MKAPITSDDKLSIAAAKLQRAAPSLWSEFMDAFSAFSGMRAGEVVQAPPDKVFVAQGRAQQCAEFSTLFANALKKADDIAAKQK